MPTLADEAEAAGHQWRAQQDDQDRDQFEHQAHAHLTDALRSEDRCNASLDRAAHVSNVTVG
jgi:hypothetical protein